MAFAFGAVTAARADVQADRDLCGSSKPAVVVPNCTKVIKDRGQPAGVRALALSNRGFASQSIGEVEDAISDYSAAIKLVLAGLGRHGPSAKLLAKIYVNRGVAYGMRSDPTRALSDYDVALALDPGLDSARYNRAALLANRHTLAP
ncbi:tetratricopeptide repeat protein [Phenylobacterium sp.]|jgi:tetratricopeptide (TPR) repeat protein|uniref:tetratricopeptide repeat protein n=1 Tax=Phenylobacterium sp. TaxID=1871053 RepID=UPI002E33B63E|nr:tetratricopeptide repeat protein [Phenylobacterium sp.]HEX4712936.1 tetratricopeptide repeat protein [Phenylobacterium sp.]